MSERRYSEQEVAEIFERATEAQKGSLRRSSPADGLTLAELQTIGGDVGIPPELVARAARSLESGGASPRRTFAGLPIGIGHTVELDRALTDTEWQHLVVDLRETFDARGKLTEEGGFRQWTNGNLEILLEPTEAGQRLRMRTLKGGAIGMILGGGAALGVAGVSLMLATGTLGDRFGDNLLLVAIGLGLLLPTVIQLPRWARLRQRQMEGIAERALLMASTGPQAADTDET